MNNTFSKSIRWAVFTILTLAVGMQISVFGQDKQEPAQEDNALRRNLSPVGVWRTLVTPRNCDTGAPLGPPFPGLFTFNKGGTMAEYGIGPGSSPALRSPGHGIWERERSWREFSFAFTFYRYDAAGIFLGSQKITANARFEPDSNSFMSNSVVNILNVNGDVVATFCATAVATPFE